METCAIVSKPAEPGRLVRGPVIAGVFAALAAVAISAAADTARRPNIVIILGDDMGYADMGSFGSEIKTRTSTRWRGRRALHELLYARELLAHPVASTKRRGYAPERPRQHGRVDRAESDGVDGYEDSSTNG